MWQAILIMGSVSGFSLSELISKIHPLSISTSDTAQQFQGWGTSLAWFGEYVGSLEGLVKIVCSAIVSLQYRMQQMQWPALRGVIQSKMVGDAVSQQDKIMDMLFDPDVGLGLEVVRYNVGGSNTTMSAVNSMRPYAAVPSTVLADGSYDWGLVSADCAPSHCAVSRVTHSLEHTRTHACAWTAHSEGRVMHFSGMQHIHDDSSLNRLECSQAP